MGLRPYIWATSTQAMQQLLDKLKQLEETSAPLEPSAENRELMAEKALAFGEQYLNALEGAKAFEESDTSRLLEEFHVEETGRSLDELLQVFEHAVVHPGISTASGGHLGYIPGGGLYPAAIADYLVALTNKYAGIYFGAPGAVRLEKTMVDWLKQLLGFPQDATGHLSSGGSIATLTAVAAARDAFGIHGARVEKAVIYSSNQAHHCLHKAIRIAGLATAIHREIPTGGVHKMPPALLEELISHDIQNGLLPFLVVSSAGTTDTGVVDDLEAISQLAKAHGLWHHVDAAYGGFFIMVEKLQPLFNGIEKADSITIDPHKGLFLPYGIGAVLIKDLEAVAKSHHYQANYMRDANEGAEMLSPADLSPELTKHFRGLRMWLPLHLFGLKPFRAALEEKHLLALYFHQKILEMGFETGGLPELSVVTYRYTAGLTDAEADIFNQKLVAAIHRDGRVFLSSTTLNGRTWMRCAILSFRTHLATIDQALEMISVCVKALKKGH
jgi:aromatic-L-amino-acid decarboxylase